MLLLSTIVATLLFPAAATIPLTATLNPNSGPGPSTDPNYLYALTNLESTGGRVIAYVFTSSGSAPRRVSKNQISTYVSQYGSGIDGFFVDAMSSSGDSICPLPIC